MPFIQPRLSSKAVEDIWTEAAQPKTAGAKLRKGKRGYSVSCNSCSPRLPDMHGLTHEGAENMVAMHNSLHHSRTAGDVNYGGGPGSDDNGRYDAHGETLWQHVRLARQAATADEIDWTGIEPGDPECASYRPSDRDETLRMVRREDDRRKTPRDTPDRRQASASFKCNWCSSEFPKSQIVHDEEINPATGRSDGPATRCPHCGSNNIQSASKLGYSTDKELEGLCAACKGPLNSFSKTVDGKRYCSQTCAESKTSTRRTAVDNWDAIMQSPELKAVWPQVRSLASQVISAHMPQDEDGAIYGISSSDVNHTVFSYAQRHWDGTHLNVGGLIHDLMDEADNSW